MKQRELLQQHFRNQVERGDVLPSEHAAFEGGNRNWKRRASDRAWYRKGVAHAVGAALLAVVSFLAGAYLDDAPAGQISISLTKAFRTGG